MIGKPETKYGRFLVWVIRIGAILLPATASAYVSYRQAKAAVEVKADAGYDVLLQAVEKLSDTVAQQTETIGYLKGRLDSIDRALEEGSFPTAEEGEKAEEEPPPPELHPMPDAAKKTIFKQELPRDLDGAYQMKQDKAIDF